MFDLKKCTMSGSTCSCSISEAPGAPGWATPGAWAAAGAAAAAAAGAAAAIAAAGAAAAVAAAGAAAAGAGSGAAAGTATAGAAAAGAAAATVAAAAGAVPRFWPGDRDLLRAAAFGGESLAAAALCRRLVLRARAPGACPRLSA